MHYSQLFPGHKAEDGLLILILIYLAAVVVTAVAGGVLSDRSGRRKLPVTVSGLVMAVPAVMLALWPSWPVASPRRKPWAWASARTPPLTRRW